MDKIAAALVKAQRGFAPALKSSSNPHFKSRYADLAACVEAVIDSLNANGIMLMQKQHPSEGGVSIETVFVHESGEMMSAGTLTVPAAKHDPQGYGSALTYARRYSLMAACGIAPEDDDGNAASKPRKPQAANTDPAAEIRAGLKRGDASGAATYLAGLPQAKLDAIWSKLTKPEQDELTAAWPKDEAA
jgi:hypothetical protein